MPTNFQQDVVTHHTNRTGVPLPVSVKRMRGLKQVLQLCVDGNLQVVAPEPVDEILHDALLFTEGYKNFCLENFGREIHHKPATISGQPSGYLETRKLAVEKFGANALQTDIWPTTDRPQWSVIYTLD